MAFANRVLLPRTTDQLLRRPQLDDRLSEWAPITVVRGLHGYGKTTQVAAWLGDQVSEKITSVWVTARPTTDGFQGFEGCLSQSLRSAGAVPEPAPGGLSPSGLDELAAALLAESPDRKFVLVIDNFHNVRDGRVLAELVSLVERRRNFHLYLCCRGHHPIESLATGTTEVNVIEPKELMLGVDEIVELAQVIGAPVDRSGAQSLRDAIGGCVLMVRMALTATEDIEARTGVVEEYLRTSILSDLGDEALLRQLMRLSLSEPVSWRLFRDLCDEPDPRRLLDSLEITGLLERVNGGPEVLFTIPALLRGMLRDEYSSTSPDGARAFHRRLAEWFAGHSDGKHVPSAFHHAGAGRDWELMDRLWSEDVTMMIKENPGLVRETLEALPADVLATRPSMQVFRDILEIAAADTDADGHRATMRAFADACTRLVKQHWDTMPLGELLIVATGYMIGLRLLGRYQDAAAFGDCVNARTSVLSATKRAAKGRFAWFYLQRGITYSLICDNASAIRSYRQAWEHGTGAGVDFVQSQAAANLALTYALGGDTTRAQQWLSCHRGIDTRDWPGDNLISIGAHVAAGLLALDRLDIAQVRSELDHLAECSAPVELWPYVAYLYAQHALHSGNALGALAHLDELQAANDGEQANKGAAVVLMTRARADLLIACGRGEKAKRLIEAQGIARPMNRVPAARIRLLSRRDGPGGDLDPLTWDPATSVRDRVEMLLLGAVSALREGDTRNAERLVNQALDLHNETGVLRPFAAIAHSDLVRLLELADRDLEADEAADLARRAPVYPENLVLVELSRHEQAVLEALATTGSRQAIADSLFVSLNTVKTQLASIHQKLGTATREETLSKAREHELLPPEGTD